MSARLADRPATAGFVLIAYIVSMSVLSAAVSRSLRLMGSLQRQVTVGALLLGAAGHSASIIIPLVGVYASFVLLGAAWDVMHFAIQFDVARSRATRPAYAVGVFVTSSSLVALKRRL